MHWTTRRTLRRVTWLCATLTVLGVAAGLLGVRVGGLGLLGSTLVLALVPADLGVMTAMAARMGRDDDRAEVER